jgi:type I restriction enzyme S subunit
MTAQQLKNSILQLAVQGKLVPNSITSDKVRITNKKPIGDDEIPFEIPESWQWVRLGEIGSIYTGTTPSKSHNEYYGKGYPFFKPSDLDTGINVIIPTEELTEVGFAHSRQLPENSILVTCIGATIGKTGLIRVNGTCNQQINAIVLNENEIPEYIYYCFNSDFFQKSIKANASSTTLPILNKSRFEQLIIPIPPLTEQRRIVAKIEELLLHLAEYDHAEQQLATLHTTFPDQLKKSILQSAVQGKLVLQDASEEPAFALLSCIRKEKEKLITNGKRKREKALPPITEDEKPFDIPNSWEWARLGEICIHNSGKTLDNGKNTGELREYITTSNLYWGYFELENLRRMPFEKNELDKCMAIKGDLLICEGGEAGRSAVWENDYPICFQNHIHRLRFYENINPYYIYYYVDKIFHSGEINKFRKGIAIKSISGNSLSNIPISLPPLAEQHRIVSKIEELMKQVEGLKIS